jgi:hypothetical protein
MEVDYPVRTSADEERLEEDASDADGDNPGNGDYVYGGEAEDIELQQPSTDFGDNQENQKEIKSQEEALPSMDDSAMKFAADRFPQSREQERALVGNILVNEGEEPVDILVRTPSNRNDRNQAGSADTTLDVDSKPGEEEFANLPPPSSNCGSKNEKAFKTDARSDCSTQRRIRCNLSLPWFEPSGLNACRPVRIFVFVFRIFGYSGRFKSIRIRIKS